MTKITSLFPMLFTLLSLTACSPPLNSDQILVEKQMSGEPLGFSNSIEFEKYIEQSTDEHNLDFKKGLLVKTGRNLSVKTEPNNSSRTSGSFSDGELITVYWPKDIQNNYIKVLNKNNTSAWLPYKDSSGSLNLLLLEESSLQEAKIPGAKISFLQIENDSSMEEPSNTLEEQNSGSLNSSPNTTSTNPHNTFPIGTNNNDLEEQIADLPVTPSLKPEVPAELPVTPSLKPQVPTAFTNQNTPTTTEQSEIEALIRNSIGRISLTTKRIAEAHRAIGKVDGSAQELLTCDIGAIIGDHAGLSSESGKWNKKRKRCYKKIVLEEEFADFFNTHGTECAKVAAEEVFGSKPNALVFNTSSGGQVLENRKVAGTGKYSTHSVGRALDLFGILLFYGTDLPKRMVFNKLQLDGSSVKETQNHKYYWAFANCWDRHVNNYSACPCKKNSSKKNLPQSIMTYKDNHAHRNHIHVSLPMCDRKDHGVACI